MYSPDPIQFYSCFISYSRQNENFAQKLHDRLQEVGVRCWLDQKNIKIGEKIRTVIDRAIKNNDKLLVILSEASLESTWVESEVEAAFEKERDHESLVLFPIQIDDTISKTEYAWAKDIRRQRLIGDFSNWENEENFNQSFERLLRDLRDSRNEKNYEGESK